VERQGRKSHFTAIVPRKCLAELRLLADTEVVHDTLLLLEGDIIHANVVVEQAQI